MNKLSVAQKIVETGILPVIRASSEDEAWRVIDAIKTGGIDIFEITMTVPNAVNLIEKLAKRFENEALIGAGTVLDAESAKKCIEAGAKFIISPALNIETIKFCNEKEIVVMPGALTPTEILTAWNAGADFVKVFPASAMGGASYLKSIKAPLPHIKLIPTGGVSLKTAADFINAGAEAVGVGADLVDLQAIRENRADSITATAGKYLELVREARM
ncbi:MAG TPA: bifunctional 4-hydroxy-2-oxoglutarate aldolase/2-dehydro-3-deoxy-phosphogluconate aldolase [Pyrinomonadaceae bacterium]|nr:bifunctional 4-hydroxy-2-oxoglutarate aldolase/2-dehydro-3-deoxy-phosphogluconate aldolase [Pyrinomonadaceae bacterium]